MLRPSPGHSRRSRRRHLSTSPATVVWRLRRHPYLYWALALLLAGLTATVTTEIARRAEAARRQWGEVRTVAVARRSISAGDVIGAGDVELRALPIAAIPEGAVAGAPRGQAARTDLYEGEVVVRDRLAPQGLEGVAALVPRGARALAVPVGSARLPLSVGDRVDILATFDLVGWGGPDSAGARADASSSASGLPPTFAVARHGHVVGLTDDAVTVAVDADEAERVAFALAQGAVTLTLAGG